MNDGGTFFWGLMFGAIGAGYFIYGKNQHNIVMLGLGALLCVFPYFVSSVTPLLVIGVVLTLAPFFINKG
jgi:hypothetical protein